MFLESKPLAMDKELEQKRLNAVNSLEVLDTPAESDFDGLVKLAAMIFEVPISTVTILDAHRQWFKAAVGLSVTETPRDISFCTHAIEHNTPLIIPNTSQDVRFADNPLVKDGLHLGFYAGVPLVTSDNLAVGTFCIMDQIPREFLPHQVEILKILANQAMKLLELRIERNKYRDLAIETARLNKELHESEQRWQFALEGSGDGVWDWDIKNQYVIYSKRGKEILGYVQDAQVNHHEIWTSLLHKDDVTTSTESLNDCLQKRIGTYQSEHRLLAKDQSYKWILTRGMVVEWDHDGTAKRMVGTHTDISSRKQSEELIWRQANYDSLTGLPNRRMFFDRLAEEIKRASRANSTFALMYIDLDGFKAINDNLGHQFGDDLLKEFARRVGQCMRESDTFARLGGDEFTVVLSDVESNSAIATIADKILQTISVPYQLESNEVLISASIGISVYPRNGKDGDTLISRADTAMYDAKAKGKHCWVLDSE